MRLEARRRRLELVEIPCRQGAAARVSCASGGGAPGAVEEPAPAVGRGERWGRGPVPAVAGRASRARAGRRAKIPLATHDDDE